MLCAMDYVKSWNPLQYCTVAAIDSALANNPHHLLLVLFRSTFDQRYIFGDGSSGHATRTGGLPNSLLQQRYDFWMCNHYPGCGHTCKFKEVVGSGIQGGATWCQLNIRFACAIYHNKSKLGAPQCFNPHWPGWICIFPEFVYPCMAHLHFCIYKD